MVASEYVGIGRCEVGFWGNFVGGRGAQWRKKRDATLVEFKGLVLAMSENSATLRYDLMGNKERQPKAEETPTAQD